MINKLINEPIAWFNKQVAIAAYMGKVEAKRRIKESLNELEVMHPGRFRVQEGGKVNRLIDMVSGTRTVFRL